MLWRVWELIVSELGGYGLSPRVVSLAAVATLVCTIATWCVLVEERGVKGVYGRYIVSGYSRVVNWCRRYIKRHNQLIEEARRVSHLGGGYLVRS